MKIVLDCEQLKNPYTGLCTFSSDLAEAMSKIVADNDDLSFFIGKLENKPFGSKYKYLRRRLWNSITCRFFLPKLDIWHSTYQLALYTGGGWATKKVLTIHDLNFLYENTSREKYDRYMHKYQKNINKADHIVAISEFVKNDILAHLDVKGKPVSVIYNGYKVKEYQEYDTPVYRPYGKFLFTIGMLNSKKNFKTLPCLLANNNYELIIAGKTDPFDPDYTQEILAEADKLGVRDRVHLLGAVSDEDKYWYLSNCLAFVFPSIAEGFGLPVLEAMHFGKPVFISNLTSLPEVGGRYAYYFEEFSPEYMQTVFENNMTDFNADRNRSKEIMEHARTFSYEKAAKAYYDIYKSLLRN